VRVRVGEMSYLYRKFYSNSDRFPNSPFRPYGTQSSFYGKELRSEIEREREIKRER
jgi:hypothetical protein